MFMHNAQMEVKELPWGVSSLPLLRDAGIKLGPSGLHIMSFCFLGHLVSPNLCNFICQLYPNKTGIYMKRKGRGEENMEGRLVSITVYSKEGLFKYVKNKIN